MSDDLFTAARAETPHDVHGVHFKWVPHRGPSRLPLDARVSPSLAGSVESPRTERTMSSPARPHRSRSRLAARPPGMELYSSFGYRRLAARVIHQAMRDVDGPSHADRETARAFLAGSPMLLFWCDLAQINAAHVIARATTDWAARLESRSIPGGGGLGLHPEAAR